MKRILFASVAAAALWVAPSFAADPAMPMEEAPVGFSWTFQLSPQIAQNMTSSLTISASASRTSSDRRTI